MNEMAIQVTAAEEVDSAVTGHLQSIIQATGVPVKLIDLSLGRANPPDAILHQRVETAAQEQRINTEKQKKLAEDQRKLAEESRAAADQAYNQKMGLNTEQYVALQAIQMQRDVCAKGTCTFIYGASATPMLNLRQ
jgi:regulator of protease activity HflC (stomatin/prohibitin superfamily)